MLGLEIDDNIVTLTDSFWIDWKVQVVIDGHNNQEKEIKSGISQGFPM